jgi:hypothetical protein
MRRGPYIENSHTQRRRYVRLPPIGQRRRASGRVQSYRRNHRPISTAKSSIPPAGTNDGYGTDMLIGDDCGDNTQEFKSGDVQLKKSFSSTEIIQQANQQHPLFKLKQDLENEITKEELQSQLQKMPTPKPNRLKSILDLNWMNISQQQSH